jgi:integration host factor beta subunit
MTKTDLIDALSKSTGLTRRETTAVVDSLFDTMTDTLATGSSVEIRGFGSFVTKKRAARVARNPKTGATVDVPPRVVPVFRPSKALKDRVGG